MFSVVALSKGCVISTFSSHCALELPSGDTSVNTEALKINESTPKALFNCLHSRQPVEQTRPPLDLNRPSI